MINTPEAATELSLTDAEKMATAGAGRILVVEDEPEILEPLAHSLGKAGFEVLRAEDGLTACRLIGTEKPDLILLDIMLPDLDGWEVCKLLREHPDKSVASTPVIMLTALNSPQDKFRGLELGADAFLPKPYAIREVILHSTNLIKRRREAVDLETRLKSVSRTEQQAVNLHHLLFHELRNQLLILNGYTELLNGNPDSNRAQTCRDAICRSSSYLQTLAEEVLLIRQVEDGQFVFKDEPFCADQLIDEIIMVYSAPAKERCMQLIHRKDIRQATVILNRTALKIILSALVDNSIKFGPSGQKIKITFTQSSKDMELTVTDQGPGIATADLPHIFEPYFRSVQHENSVRGTGIGLHAVCVLANAMGGHVTAENIPNQGSCFRLHLPRQSTALI
jgi:DNA-binding response OmpR family regulator